MATRYFAPEYQKRSRPKSETGLKVEALLARYPDLGEREIGELVYLFSYLPRIDLGAMIADERMSAKLGAFHRDHGDKLKAPVTGLMLSLVIPAIVAVGTLWWILA